MDKDGKGAPLSFAGLAKDAMKANKHRRAARLAQMETEIQAEAEKRTRLSAEEEEERKEEGEEGKHAEGEERDDHEVGSPKQGKPSGVRPEEILQSPRKPTPVRQHPPEPKIPKPMGQKVPVGFPDLLSFSPPWVNALVVTPLQVRAPPVTKKSGFVDSTAGASTVRGGSSRPPTAARKPGSARRDLHKIKENVEDFERVKGASSYCSDDPPEGFTRYAYDIFNYTTPDALRRDFKDTPLDGIAGRLVRDLYLTGLRATELASRTYEFSKAMQGKLPQEWLTTFEREQKAKDEEYTRLMVAIQEEKKKADADREAALKKNDESTALLESKEEEIFRLQAEVAKLRATLGAEEEEKKKMAEQRLAMEEELKALQGKLAEGEDVALGAFLGSRAFEAAALTGASVEMRRVLYGVVDALTEFWPFRAEEFGINEVADDERAPDLRTYRWDRQNDRLQSPDGETLEPPAVCPDISSFEQIKPKNPWPMKYYPLKAEDNRLAQVIAAGEKALAEAAAEAEKEKKRKRTD